MYLLLVLWGQIKQPETVLLTARSLAEYHGNEASSPEKNEPRQSTAVGLVSSEHTKSDLHCTYSSSSASQNLSSTTSCASKVNTN